MKHYTNDLRDQGEELFNEAKEVREGLSDPKKFLARALGSNNSLLRRLTEDPSYKYTTGIDPSLGEQIYRFAQEYAKLGFEATRNPIISSIQLESLRQIGDLFKGNLQVMDGLSARLHDFSAVSQRSTSIPIPIRPQPRATLDCAVFSNEAASRELLQIDSDGWLALYQKCAK